MFVDVVLKKMFDVIIIIVLIVFVLKLFDFLIIEQDVFGKLCGVEVFYWIRNYIGFDVVVYFKSLISDEFIILKFDDGLEVFWSFEYWEKM